MTPTLVTDWTIGDICKGFQWVREYRPPTHLDFLTGKRVLWYQVIIQKSESRATVICAIFGSFSHSYGAMSRSIRIFARK